MEFITEDTKAIDLKSLSYNMFRFQDHIDTCLTTIGVQADSRLEKPMTCLLKILTSTLTLKLFFTKSFLSFTIYHTNSDHQQFNSKCANCFVSIFSERWSV
jgi:hypothetical protein